MSKMLKHSGKKFCEHGQTDNSLTTELEVAMPMLKSLQNISRSFSPPPLSTLGNLATHMSVSMSVMQGREESTEGRRERGKEGRRDEWVQDDLQN